VGITSSNRGGYVDNDYKRGGPLFGAFYCLFTSPAPSVLHRLLRSRSVIHLGAFYCYVSSIAHSHYLATIPSQCALSLVLFKQ